MKVKVRNINPNPYRNIDHYPLNKEKIMALTNSIEKTGFWDNLVGREINGEIQIAYGHHRVEALRLAEGSVMILNLIYLSRILMMVQ